MGDGRPPLSRLALAAGIIGLIFVVPWPPLVAFSKKGIQAIGTGTFIGMIGAVVAIILGVIAILHTRKGRRRGLWLGVMGVVFGLFGLVFQFGAGIGLYNYFGSIGHARKAVLVLKTPSSERSNAAEKWHEEFASKRLQVSVTPEEFEEWLKQVTDEYGQLQVAELNKSGSFASKNGVTTVNFKGHFVNGLTPVKVEVGLDKDGFRVDNFRVGDSSILD